MLQCTSGSNSSAAFGSPSCMASRMRVMSLMGCDEANHKIRVAGETKPAAAVEPRRDISLDGGEVTPTFLRAVHSQAGSCRRVKLPNADFDVGGYLCLSPEALVLLKQESWRD